MTSIQYVESARPYRSFSTIYVSAVLVILWTSFALSLYFYLATGSFPFTLYRFAEPSFAYVSHALIGYVILSLWSVQLALGLNAHVGRLGAYHARLGYWVFGLLFVYILISTGLAAYWNTVSEPLTQRSLYGVMGLPLLGVVSMVYLVRAVRSARRGDLTSHKNHMIFVLTAFTGVAFMRGAAVLLRTLDLDPRTSELFVLGTPWDRGLQFEDVQFFITSAMVLLMWVIYATRYRLLKSDWGKTTLLCVPLATSPAAFVT